MVAIGISEFTFGYAFLYEQTQANWANLRAAPVLPSLQQEQQVGWDAHLPLNGIDYYYQFKLSDYLSRSNAKFIKEGPYDDPYYRVSLHRKDYNRQHQRLREHSQSNPYTYYIAPEFNNADDFNSAFLARQITASSRIIPVAECDDIDDGEQHYITFQLGDAGWNQHSERRRHEKSYTGREVEKVYRESASQWKAIDRHFAEELFEKTSTAARKVLEREHHGEKITEPELLLVPVAQPTERDLLLKSSEILSVFLGVTLVLVGTSE
jgi:hypothetical protein